MANTPNCFKTYLDNSLIVKQIDLAVWITGRHLTTGKTRDHRVHEMSTLLVPDLW